MALVSSFPFLLPFVLLASCAGIEKRRRNSKTSAAAKWPGVGGFFRRIEFFNMDLTLSQVHFVGMGAQCRVLAAIFTWHKKVNSPLMSIFQGHHTWKHHFISVEMLSVDFQNMHIFFLRNSLVVLDQFLELNIWTGFRTQCARDWQSHASLLLSLVVMDAAQRCRQERWNDGLSWTWNLHSWKQNEEVVKIPS